MSQDRLITFDKPGGYVVKLMAVNGAQYVLKSDIAQVNPAPRGGLTAVLTIAVQGTKVEQLVSDYSFSETYPPHATEDPHPVSKEFQARAGYEISDVRLQSSSGPAQSLAGKGELTFAAPAGCRGARNLRLQLSPDHKSVRLTGMLVKEASLGQRNAPLPNLLVPVVVVQERRTPAQRPPVPMTASLALPSTVTLPLPPPPTDWVDAKRTVRLELRNGDQVVWQGSQLPRGVVIPVSNRRVVLTATQLGEQVRIDLRDAVGLPPTTN
jgi:hypothetical protein